MIKQNNCKIKLNFVVTTLMLLLTVNSVNAQCKNFAKNKCLPNIAPYIHNGQMNGAIMMAGEKAELQMTFYSGQDYRLMVCAQPILGDVAFRLLDKNKKVVFNNKDHKNVSYWDFNVTSTQQMFLEIEVPESTSKHGMIPSGCVIVLVGFKPKE
jgi:hypothetical protein